MNPKRNNYRWYGGKGIKVCKEWDEYLNFHKDMADSYYLHVEEFGEKDTTIDRVDCTKGYNLENCKWSTRLEQGQNLSSNRLIEYKGVKKPIRTWARELGINYMTLYSRLVVYKIPVERAFDPKKIK